MTRESILVQLLTLQIKKFTEYQVSRSKLKRCGVLSDNINCLGIFLLAKKKTGGWFHYPQVQVGPTLANESFWIISENEKTVECSGPAAGPETTRQVSLNTFTGDAEQEQEQAKALRP